MGRELLRVEKDIHQIKLNQLGAEVKAVDGILHYVWYSVKGINIKYAYHINDGGEYFLQRLEPYPISFGNYPSHNDVIDIIEHDILQMNNAEKSKKFVNFIEINKKINKALRAFDDLYLYYNVSRVQTEKIIEKINDLEQVIYETKDVSERVYFGKDPEGI